MLPVNQILAFCVAPVHVAPAVAVWVVLVECVVPALIIDRAVGVIHPVGGRHKVIARAVGVICNAGCCVKYALHSLLYLRVSFAHYDSPVCAGFRHRLSVRVRNTATPMTLSVFGVSKASGDLDWGYLISEFLYTFIGSENHQHIALFESLLASWDYGAARGALLLCSADSQYGNAVGASHRSFYECLPYNKCWHFYFGDTYSVCDFEVIDGGICQQGSGEADSAVAVGVNHHVGPDSL